MKLKRLHPWDLKPIQARRLQEELSRKIKLTKLKEKIHLIAGADVNFKDNLAIGVVVILSYPELGLLEWVRKTKRISYPYIPGLLSFREGPVLEACLQDLKRQPDIFIFDGQGIAHPRNMGIATHMGILLGKPTMGCAKSWLWGRYKQPGPKRGSFAYLFNEENKKIGIVLRTKDFVKPLFVSPGYKVGFKDCIRIILRCTLKYRLPEPLRLAHQLGVI
ncbi:MAG: endonuclease V [Candidatus Omnitrophica bacterium]|nr:endonuclease V [Candidatus Omnitrophota bacterium]